MIESFISLLIPLLLATLGGLYSEKAGILNISLEGLLITSAFYSLAVLSFSGSLFLGILAGVMASLLLTLLFILSTLVLKSDPFVSGLGINILAYPLVLSSSRLLFGTEGTVRPENIPVPGTALFFVLALLLLLFTLIFFGRTNPGRLIAYCGGSEERICQKGHSPQRIKFFALLLGSCFVGVAGASLSLPLGVFVPGMSAGKGWLALVAVYLAGGRGKGVFPAVALFAFFELMAVNLQQFNSLPHDLVLSIPYFLTLLVTTLLKMFKKKHKSVRNR
ncbi:MAG: ABC transporter permease [Spirochaetales bacterium]|nr:ABC transporter permease [Spirochaetales bacterium]